MTHSFFDFDLHDLHTNIFQDGAIKFHENRIHHSIEAQLPIRRHHSLTQLTNCVGQEGSSSLILPGKTASVVDIYQKEDEFYRRLGSCFKALFVPSASKEVTVEVQKEDVLEIGQQTSNSIKITQSPKKRIHSPITNQLFSPDHSLDMLLGSVALHHQTLEDDEISTRYLKIKSKYVTDGQGVVSGVLLVTPQTVMFNPDVSDHLVMDRGREMYVVRLSLKAISRLLFFEDIAAMVLGDVTKQYFPNSRFIDYNSESLPKPGTVICEGSGKRFLLNSELLKKDNLNEVINNTQGQNMQDTILDLNLTHIHNDTDENVKTSLPDKSVTECKPKDTAHSNSDNAHSESGISSLYCVSTLPSTSKDFSDNVNETLTPTTLMDCGSPQSGLDSKHDLSMFINESHSSSTPKHVPFKDQYLVDERDVSSDTVVHDDDNITIEFDDSAKQKNDRSLMNDRLISASFKDKKENSRIVDHFNANDLSQKLPFQLAATPVMPPGCNISKDSGISDVTTMSHSNQETHEVDHNRYQRHPALASRCSLSDEAQQWLGKRGIRISTMKGEDAQAVSAKDNLSEAVLPRPASKTEDALMYVAIKIHNSYWYTNRTRKNSIMGVPPNRDQKRHQHWFAIPKERVDQFYSFLLHWAPDVSVISSAASTPVSEEFLDSEEALPVVENAFGDSSPSPATKLGYEKVDHNDASSLTKRCGSITSVSSKASSIEDDLLDLQAESNLLTRLQIRLLAKSLPKRTVGHSWELVYSTHLHGFSLSTLYRNFQDYDNATLIVVKDENQKIFGGFISEPPRKSEGFYGTGESMLFSFVADNKIVPYQWTGENHFFVQGSKTSFAIGGGEGVFGLWLDEDLYHGRSHYCKTFNNDTLSFNEDFVCTGLEAWAFT